MFSAVMATCWKETTQLSATLLTGLGWHLGARKVRGVFIEISKTRQDIIADSIKKIRSLLFQRRQIHGNCIHMSSKNNWDYNRPEDQ